MSDQQIAQDIARVQQRIDRLRGRIGQHWREVEKLPSQSASQAWSSLGHFAQGFRASDAGSGRSWLWGLVAAAAGWYFSQPGAVRGLWRAIYPHVKAWKQQPESTETPA